MTFCASQRGGGTLTCTSDLSHLVSHYTRAEYNKDLLWAPSLYFLLFNIQDHFVCILEDTCSSLPAASSLTSSWNRAMVFSLLMLQGEADTADPEHESPKSGYLWLHCCLDGFKEPPSRVSKVTTGHRTLSNDTNNPEARRCSDTL